MGSKRKNKKTRYNKKQQEYKDNLFDSNENVAFIADYTSCGFAYGITWEEMGEIERRDKELFGGEHNCHKQDETDLPFD